MSEPLPPHEKVKQFPPSPGVYLMKDAQGRVLYVCKAKNLRNRAGHYFTRVAAEGDQIGVLATYEGTHKGQLWDIPATGKPVNFTFAGMFRVADGKLAEFWITWDNVTVLSQLGVMPS